MLKSLLVSLSCVVALGAAAQQSGSFTYQIKKQADNFSAEAMEATYAVAGQTTNGAYLCTWFDSDFSMQVIDHTAKTFTESSIYEMVKGNPKELIMSKQKTIINEAKLHGIYCEPELVGEIVYVTVPSKFNNKGTEEDVTKPGTIVFHITMGGKPQRVNDENNVWGAYLYNMTGAKVGIYAPEGAVVKAYFSTPGVAYQDVPKNLCSAIVDFDNVPANTYAEIKSGVPYNSNAVMDAEAWADKWPSGYCCKFVDIAVSNVNPGDRVGFGGIQTLYPGCKEEELAGVEDAIAEDATDAPVVYYNLQGVRVENPANGIFIKAQGSKATKVVL